MARRYVRDKAGRFAPKGGGGKRAGKLSKSTGRGRSAKAAYHDAKSDLRFEKRLGSPGVTGTKNTRAIRKSQKKLTTLSNRMTGKGKAAGSGIKKGLRSQTASRRKQTFKSKTTKGRAAKAEWKAARRADRTDRSTKQEGRGLDRNQKRVIKKQTGKTTYAQGYRETPAKTKAPRPGAKTKAQKIRAKIELKKSYNKMERGSEFKGKRKGTAKQLAAGKKRSAAAKAKKAAARKASFKGKATQGRAAKAKYKSAASKVREKKRVLDYAKRESAGDKIKQWTGDPVPRAKKEASAAKGGLTRVTNKLTAKRAAATPTKKKAATKKVKKKKEVGGKVKGRTAKSALRPKSKVVKFKRKPKKAFKDTIKDLRKRTRWIKEDMVKQRVGIRETLSLAGKMKKGMGYKRGWKNPYQRKGKQPKSKIVKFKRKRK